MHQISMEIFMVFVQDIFGYTATKFMFHRPSEHNIEGSCYDLEMQIAHKLKIELIQCHHYESDTFNFIRSFEQKLTTYHFTLVVQITYSNKKNPNNSTNIASINFYDLFGSQLDANPTYYTYVGSLTIPDCYGK